MAIDSGTTFALRKSKTARFTTADTDEAFLVVPEWSPTGKYLVDESVITIASTGDNYATWYAIVDHDAEASDDTPSTDANPTTLVTTKWAQYEPNQLLSMQNMEFSRGQTTTTLKYMVNLQGRSSTSPEPDTITITLFSNADRQQIERLYGRSGTRLYMDVFVGGKKPVGTKGIRMSGFVLVTDTSLSFPGDGGQITKTINFVVDDSDADAFKEIEYTDGGAA